MAERAAEATGAGEGGLAAVLVRLSHLVEQIFVEEGRRFELTQQQAQLLCVLAEAPMGMTELSRALNLEKSSLTGLVNRVEDRGLVVRQRAPKDRRAYSAALTEVGARKADELYQAINTRLGSLADHLPFEDRALVTALLARMVDPH